MRKQLAALVAAFLIAAPLAAQAQIVPSYSDSAPDAGGGEAQIHGRVLSFDGGYSVQVRDEKGYVDEVQLHQGTIINPTGLTLAPGMVVSIMGYNAGSYFAANEIDTPYTFYSGLPYYAGHPWNYYGAGFSLGFFFGNAGWWHGGAFYGSPRFVGGVRFYPHYNGFYRGGGYVGHNYVVPRARGGYYGGGYYGGGVHVDAGRRFPQGAPAHGEYHGGGPAYGQYHGGAPAHAEYHGGESHGGGSHGGEHH